MLILGAVLWFLSCIAFNRDDYNMYCKGQGVGASTKKSCAWNNNSEVKRLSVQDCLDHIEPT